MQMSTEVDVAELAEVFWDELVERLITTDPLCADLFDRITGHELDLKITWNIQDGAVTGTLRCARCVATTAWTVTASLSGIWDRHAQLAASGEGDQDLDERWRNLACWQPSPVVETASHDDDDDSK